MRALVPLALLLVSCASPAATVRPVTVAPSASPDTTCPANAAARFAMVPFASLGLEGVSTPLWTGAIEGAEHLSRCLTISVEGHRRTLLATFVVDDEILTSQVLVAMFDGDTFVRAHVVRDPGAPLVPEGGCAEELGMGSAPLLRALAIEPSAGIPGALVRLEILRDVCGVACGTLSVDTALISVAPSALARAFVCRVFEEPYVVSNEQAESFSCDRAPRDQTLRVVDGGLERCTTDAPPVCRRYTWDGSRFTGTDAPAGVCLD